MSTSTATVVAPPPLTNKWPAKLTRAVLDKLGIHNSHNLTLRGEPIISWRPAGKWQIAAWLLWRRDYKFKSTPWYDYGSLSFIPMKPEEKQTKLLEAIYKADALGLCAPHQWVKTPWGDYVPVAACRRAWERAFPGKVFPLNAK